MASSVSTSSDTRAWVITGPTSGIGRRTAMALAEHGPVVLVGRDRGKLAQLEEEIRAGGGIATSVVCDMSDIVSARRAAAQVAALGLPIVGVLNNAGIMTARPFTTAQGWDGAFATNHLGPSAFTEALLPALADGTNVVFVCSNAEDPERRFARAVGFRGSRYISAEASARGEWLPGGATTPGMDAYATSKQGNLATVLAFARETPRLRFNAVEPGFTPGSSLGREGNVAVRLLFRYVLSPVAPMVKSWSNPERAARIITTILTDTSNRSGVYYDNRGRPMLPSAQVRDPAFHERYVAETRALLATVPDPADAETTGPARRAMHAGGSRGG